MASQTNSILIAYRQLSGLYKNPTRHDSLLAVDGIAAANVNDELLKRHQTLLVAFSAHQSELERDQALYYKILALLFEIDDYFGVESPLRSLIVKECRKLIRRFANKPNKEGTRPFDR